MTRLIFFLCDQMLATSLVLPLEQFRAAQHLALLQDRRSFGRLEVLLASLDGKPVRTHSGINLSPDCSIADVDESQLVYLPALWRNPQPVLRANCALLPWLIRQHELGATLAGVGTGCCFLAEAGLLDNRPATTHWYYFDSFARQYPLVNLKRHHFITGADNLFCTASVNSLADLTIHFIQQLFDSGVAASVERHFFHEIRQAFATSRQEPASLGLHHDEIIAEAQSWIRQNVLDSFTVKDLAKQQKMSLRTFNRRFKAATGQTPLEYVQTLRMRTARDLLQNSNLSVMEIAFRTGYQDTTHFNSLFKRHFDTTPSQYRSTVRRKLFSAD